MGAGKQRKLPQKIFCHLTGKQEDTAQHLERFCRFYVGQPPKPSLGNQVCHDDCTIPRRFDIPGLAVPDEK